MRLLTIETATRRGTVAVLQDQSLLAVAENLAPRSFAERLVPMIDEVLARAGWTLADLELVAVGIGPGSFTGVRVGVATAKGLALALDIGLIGVVSLDAISLAARQIAGPTAVVGMLDAKKAEVFAAAYDTDGMCLAGPLNLSRADVRPWIDALTSTRSISPVVVGEVADELDLPGYRRLRAPGCDLPSPPAMAELALARWRAGRVNEIDRLEPVYVRPPDIHVPHGRQQPGAPNKLGQACKTSIPQTENDCSDALESTFRKVT